MSEGALERLVRRDRAIVLACLIVIVLMSWAYLAWPGGAGAEPAMAMDHMAMAPEIRPWTPAQFALTFAMWAVMMIGMMIPSAAPMLLLYARVARHSAERLQPFAPTAWFAAGYLLAWTGFALAATALQWLLERAALMGPAMSLADGPLPPLLLAAAGLYQWTGLKHACLSHCRAPFHFIQAHGGFRRERGASLHLGLTHGLYCIGCCWALMLLLFLGGIMNLLWIAALAVLVLAEKLVPAGPWLARDRGGLHPRRRSDARGLDLAARKSGRTAVMPIPDQGRDDDSRRSGAFHASSAAYRSISGSPSECPLSTHCGHRPFPSSCRREGADIGSCNP